MHTAVQFKLNHYGVILVVVTQQKNKYRCDGKLSNKLVNVTALQFDFNQ